MKILVVTGASGGHIFPALSFLDTLELKHKEINTLLVLPKKSDRGWLASTGYNVRYISTSVIRLSADLRNLVAVLNFLKGAFQSFFIILEFRPDIVVGFGSLDSVPLVLLAWFFRIKTLIHEQNVIPGRANRLLGLCADKIAVSFADTKSYFKDSRNIALTGNPIRQDLKRIDRRQALNFFWFQDNKFTILVMGGSLGSHSINIGFLKAVSGLKRLAGLQIIHITGTRDYDLINNSYKEANLKARIFRFLKEMQYAYNAADLVICRAGATTISELMFFAAPAILIPYPFAYNHQLKNAEVLQKLGTAVIIKDSDLETDSLRRELEGLINNPGKINSMRSSYEDALEPPASDLLMEEVLAIR